MVDLHHNTRPFVLQALGEEMVIDGAVLHLQILGDDLGEEVVRLEVFVEVGAEAIQVYSAGTWVTPGVDEREDL